MPSAAHVPARFIQAARPHACQGREALWRRVTGAQPAVVAHHCRFFPPRGMDHLRVPACIVRLNRMENCGEGAHLPQEPFSDACPRPPLEARQRADGALGVCPRASTSPPSKAETASGQGSLNIVQIYPILSLRTERNSSGGCGRRAGAMAWQCASRPAMARAAMAACTTESASLR